MGKGPEEWRGGPPAGRGAGGPGRGGEWGGGGARRGGGAAHGVGRGGPAWDAPVGPPPGFPAKVRSLLLILCHIGCRPRRPA